jgi:hypothetical protein
MRLLPWVAALALASCSAQSAARVADPLPPAPTQWVRLTPEPVRIDGRRIEPTCSDAPGADPAFQFWAKRGSVNRLVVYFDGGGACWDDITCSVPRLANGRGEGDGFYKAELMPGDDPTRMSGIFDHNNPRNPVRDWSFVFIPYCTGDVHAGSNTARYSDPDTGETYTVQHRGADNFRAVLAWMRENFAAPEQILVAGSSAGAYGAATHFARIRDAFPSGRAAMIGDAGQGVTTPDFLERRNGNWRYELPESVFGRRAHLTTDDDVVGRLAAHFTGDRFAQYTTAHDRTQSAFYALMGAQNACGGWSERMAGDLARRQTAANFRSYLAAGASHTILRSPLFYAEQSGGAPFAEWLAAMLNEGDGWTNRSCEACLAAPPPQRCGF